MVLRSVPLLLTAVSALSLAIAASGCAVFANQHAKQRTERVLATPEAKLTIGKDVGPAAVRVVYVGYGERANGEALGRSEQVVTVAGPEPLPLKQVATAALPASPQAQARFLDLNTASVEEINSISGAGLIGKAVARGRPYQSVGDLISKRILSRTKFEQIRSRVVVRS